MSEQKSDHFANISNAIPDLKFDLYFTEVVDALIIG